MNDQAAAPGLIRTQSAELARAGAKSQVARGRSELRKREEAETCLRKGLELRDAVPPDPRWQVNPAGAIPTREDLIRTIIPAYIERVSAGTAPEDAAKELGMTREDQELAHTIQFFMPDTFAEFVREEGDRKAKVLQKRNQMLAEAFGCFEKGLEIDPLHPELTYWLAESYRTGEGVHEDQGRALSLFQKAADMGYARAQTAIGDAYAHCGWDAILEEDWVEAFKWWEAAAAQGDGEALCMTANFEQGIGIEQEHSATVRLAREGAALKRRRFQRIRQRLW